MEKREFLIEIRTRTDFLADRDADLRQIDAGRRKEETVEELEENLKDAYMMMVTENVPESYQMKEISL